MYKIYFIQAIRMLRQNPFISLIAMTGTALAIMMIMTIIVSEEIKNISVAPEINRHRTFYLTGVTELNRENHIRSGSINLDKYRGYLCDLETPEAISAVSENKGISLINRPNSKEYIPGIIKSTDHSFWQIFSFTFIEGQSFSREASESGVKEAVISESMVKKLFKGEQALGQMVEIYQLPYRVTGIVKDVSALFSVAHGDVWLPYNSDPMWDTGHMVVLLAHKKEDYLQISEEVRIAEKKYFAATSDWEANFYGPSSHQVFQIDPRGGDMESMSKSLKTEYKKRLFIFLILLFVPAINLSGLSLSRIKKRFEEIGIRKAFGAKRYTILIQVLFENFITSLIGGFIGLILSYGIIIKLKQWLLNIPDNQAIPLNTLISVPVLISVFTVCILLNLLSAGIPAWKTANVSIINSITQNDKTV